MKIFYIEVMYKNLKKINENIMKFEDRWKNLFLLNLNKDRYGFKNDLCILFCFYKCES